MAPIKIDDKAIKNLANLLKETDLSEIEISEGDKTIRVVRNINGSSILPAPLGVNRNNIAEIADLTEASKENHKGTVKSPMVGTVYLQPAPGEETFIDVGGKVKKGDTLLIVEAMKVMNPIKAEKGGTIIDILVEDSQPVEFDQALVIIG